MMMQKHVNVLFVKLLFIYDKHCGKVISFSHLFRIWILAKHAGKGVQSCVVWTLLKSCGLTKVNGKNLP